MNEQLKDMWQYIEDHSGEAYDLLLTLGKIPAPSNHEEERARFCRNWLEKQGAKGVYIDSAWNVIYPIGCTGDNPVIVFAAHTDIVFPDTEPLPLVVEEGKIKAPGIGDDTANLCALLMCGKYIAQKEILPQNGGMLLVANTGEEGLGNLKGSRQIIKDFGSRMTAFYSLDGYMEGIVNDAVGSKRYKVEILTEGGHSFGKFGNRNAIAYLASLINTLYTLKVPETKTKTTYNVGMISGGTSVNTIAQQAEMLYEFRSDSREDLEFMDRHFHSVIESYRAKMIDVNTTLMGERPCTGDVDEKPEKELVEHVSEVIYKHTGNRPKRGPGSTDCNIPLSMGIPSVCFGAVRGGLVHTRQEWIETDSLMDGYRIAFEVILSYF